MHLPVTSRSPLLRAVPVVAVVFASAVSAQAASVSHLSGEYVEARTAEVFAGGCIMSSEAETIGRQAVMAWRIHSGAVDGVPLGGLSVVAAVSGNRNLGISEIGGEAPTHVRAAVIVDGRATPAQRTALVQFVREASSGLIDEVVDVTTAPIRFDSSADVVRVSAGTARLAVQRHLHHDPACGAMQWFHPLARVDDAAIGLTEAHAFSGTALGTRWSAPNRRSGFVGTFTY